MCNLFTAWHTAAQIVCFALGPPPTGRNLQSALKLLACGSGTGWKQQKSRKKAGEDAQEEMMSEDGAVVAALLAPGGLFTFKEEQTIAQRSSPAWAACSRFTPNRLGQQSS